jgi:hypothetical protein
MNKSGRVIAMILTAIGLLIVPVLTWAQARPIKGAVVYLKIPMIFFKMKTPTWSRPFLTAVVEPLADGATVNGEPDWRLIGFPPMLKYKVKGFKTQAMSKGMPYGPGEAEFENEIINIKVSFPKGKMAELFPLVFATEDEVKPYRADTYKLLAAKFFDGTPLASLSDAQKNALCTFANITAAGTTMGSVIYKEKLYLSVDLGRDTQVYNDLRLNQVQRAAHVLNERLFLVLKAFAIPVKDVKDLYGLKLEMAIPHKSFSDEYANPDLDKLEIYAPAELIQKFSDADITSQQFIDGCVVIVGGNRISVPLAIT